MDTLTDKVAVVTGGAGGIGHALATCFAAEGMHLVLADIDGDALDRAVAAFTASGTEAIGVVTDVSKRDDVRALAAQAVERFGTVNVICNNAGIGGGTGPSWLISDAAWDWTIDVNLRSVVYGIQAFVPILLEHDDGHIVNTASLAGLTAVPFVAPYTATKHGVVALSEALFHELAFQRSNIGVTVLCPAFLKTNIANSLGHFPGRIEEATVVGDAGTEFIQTVMVGGVANGGDPATYAQSVVDAIKTKRFMVVTDADEAVAVIRAKAHEAEGEPPRPPEMR
jgi:NAD(P)-dependent dehydrogenase (short-subunit alcohol dehydrogenase family)